MKHTTLARSLAIAAALSAIVVITFGGILKPGYSAMSNFISELTATGTPHAQAIGMFGFIPIAVLLAAFLIVAAPIVQVRGASRVGYFLLFTQPIAYVGAALAPCDIGCPAQGSATQNIHNLIAVVTYFGAGVGLFLLSRAPVLKGAAKAGFVIAAIAWMAVFMLMLEPALSAWRGLFQRIAEVILWTAVLFIAWRMLPERNA